MDSTLNYVLAFAGVFTGIFIRTILPYIQKLEENPELKFRKVYLLNAAVTAVITAVTMMKLYTITHGSPEDVFIMALLFSFAVDEGLIRIMKGYSSNKDGKETKAIISEYHSNIKKIDDILKNK